MRIIGNNPAADNAEITAVASGTLPDGKAVIVNADGTVSVVAGVSFASGSFQNFLSSRTEWPSSTFDSNSNKIVVAYRDDSNNYGYAVVGEIDTSDNSISFGTPVLFESGTTVFPSATFDSNSNKVVISYSDGSSGDNGTAIVGTVSGTSISFGTPVLFETARATYVATTFDPTSNKIVTLYTANSNSSYGTAIIGTVNGTSISFGNKTVFESASVNNISVAYNENDQKVVVSYRDNGNSGYGTAVVGTVSGTSISFGTAVVIKASSASPTATAYDSSSQKVIVAYRDIGNSSYGTANVGTISGTSISFGSPVVFESASTDYINISAGGGKVLIAYTDVGNSSFITVAEGVVSGTSITFESSVTLSSTVSAYNSVTFSSTSERFVVSSRTGTTTLLGQSVVVQASGTNLTSENFIGFADGAAADTGPARVQVGSGINGAQSSLTIGQQYFVQTDGTLGLTAADPSVIAGTAISATEIIVKG